MDKKAVRSMLRAREREFLSSGLASRESASVWERVSQMASFRKASTVLVYMSMPGEPDTSFFLQRWYGRKRLVIPLVVGSGLELREYSPSSVVPGYRGISEPSLSAPVVRPSEIEFAIVPGIAFAPAVGGGFVRLGHGGGFYDRLLPLLTCPVCGVCFSFRLLSELPCDPWDIPVSDLVSGTLETS